MTNEVHERKRVVYGMNEAELRSAMDSYCLAKSKGALVDIFGIDEDSLDEVKIKDQLLACVGAGITIGMELASNPYVLRHHFEDVTGASAPAPSSYQLEEGKGVSGVLLPSGEFLKCLNAEHYLISHTEDPNACLYFSSKLDGVDGVVSVSPVKKFVPTEGQLITVEALRGYMDASQFSMLATLLQHD